jgi:hypothetical protein
MHDVRKFPAAFQFHSLGIGFLQEPSRIGERRLRRYLIR